MAGDTKTLTLRTIREGEHARAAALWTRSKRGAYPWLAIEQSRSDAENLAYFRDSICARCRVWLALRGDRCLGLLALENSHIDQLYVEPDAQGSGVGSALIAHAKALEPSGLSLFTFQRNERARVFYEARGFRAVRFGVSPAPESEPDVRYEWP